MDCEETFDSSADLFDNNFDSPEALPGGMANNSSNQDDGSTIAKQSQDTPVQKQDICSTLMSNERDIGLLGDSRLRQAVSQENEREFETEHIEEGLCSKRQRKCEAEYTENNNSEEINQINGDIIVLDDSEDDEARKLSDSDAIDGSLQLDGSKGHKIYNKTNKPQSSSSQNETGSSVDEPNRTVDHEQKEFVDYSLRDAHENVIDQEKDKPSINSELTCPFCSLQEVSLYRLEFHVATEHPEFSSPDAGLVGLNTDSASAAFDALAEEDPFRFICPLCDLDLGDEETLNLHLNTMHEEEQREGGGTHSISCPLCGVSCYSEQEMKQHIKSHTNDSTYHGISANDKLSSNEATSSTCLTLRQMDCPVCGLEMADPDLLTSHVESHFNPQHSIGPSSSSGAQKTDFSKETAAKSNAGNQSERTQNTENFPSWNKGTGAPSSSRDTGNYRLQYELNLGKAVMKGELSVSDYHEMKSRLAQKDLRDVDDGSTKTQGLTEKIKSLFRMQARPGQVVYLCSSTDHFSGSYGDKGWGCGYRNFQMMLSALSRHPDYAARIFPEGDTSIPSIPKIQQMIEAAWKMGFDPQGCSQLNGRLVNTRKWIGATEIVATLSSLGAKCRLVDFHAPTASDGTHPRLLEWVLNYFSQTREFIPPLYLQHQGHSRTIIGVETEKETIKLLLFDPGSTYEFMSSLTKGQLGWKQMRTFRRTQAGFKARQYQIVAVIGLLKDSEYQESKTLTSERIS